MKKRLIILFGIFFIFIFFSNFKISNAQNPMINLYIFKSGFYSGKQIEIGMNNDEVNNIINSCGSLAQIIPRYLYCTYPKAVIPSDTEYELIIKNLNPNSPFYLTFTCDNKSNTTILTPTSQTYSLLGSFRLENNQSVSYCNIKVIQGNSGDIKNFWIVNVKNLNSMPYYIVPENITVQPNENIKFIVYNNKLYCPNPNECNQNNNCLPSGELKIKSQKFLQKNNSVSDILNILSSIFNIKQSEAQKTRTNGVLIDSSIFNNINNITTSLLYVAPSTEGTYELGIYDKNNNLISNIITVRVNISSQREIKCFFGFAYSCPPGASSPSQCIREPKYDLNCKLPIIRE